MARVGISDIEKFLANGEKHLASMREMVEKGKADINQLQLPVIQATVEYLRSECSVFVDKFQNKGRSKGRGGIQYSGC